MRDQVTLIILIISLWGFSAMLGEWGTRARIDRHMAAQDAQIQQLQETLEDIKAQVYESEPLKAEPTEETSETGELPTEEADE